MLTRLGTMAGALALIAGSAAAQSGGDYVLGLSHDATGPYVTSSRTTEVAVDLAVKEINDAGGVNGKKLRIVKFDTGGDPKQAALAIARFAEDDHALAVIGPYATAEARVGFPVAEREKIVAISNSSTVPGVTKSFKFAFRLTTLDSVAFPVVLQVMKEKKLFGDAAPSAAVMYVSDDAGMKAVGADVYPPIFSAEGVKLVAGPVGFAYNAFDLAPAVTKLLPDKPAAVAVAGVVEPAIKVATELHRQGYQGRMIGSLLFADPDFAGKVGAAGDGALYATWFYSGANDRSKAFTAKFNAATKALGLQKAGPHHVDASAYDIVGLLAQVIKDEKLTGDPGKVQDERLKLRDGLEKASYTGAVGAVHFTADHDASLPIYVMEVKDGSVSLIGQKNPATP